MRTLVVTAANEAFMPLLRGLIESLQQWQPRPFTDLAVLDVGLEPQSREWVLQHASQLVMPGWDLPVDSRLREASPHLRALTARPFLPNYFPGYDVYFWIDADAWVQEQFAFDLYFKAARQGRLAAAPQVDRAYRQTTRDLGWRTGRMQKLFGEQAGRRALWDTYINAGVFALSSQAPHWAQWEKHFRAGLARTNGLLCCDQSALNHAIWAEELVLHPLPATCNWLCHLTPPAFDHGRNKFREPFAPSGLIGILHLTAKTKDMQLQLSGDNHPPRIVSLRFPEKPRP